MTKADIYALYIEVSHRFMDIFDEVIKVEKLSLFKEEIYREKIKIVELELKNVLFEIECFENGRDNKNKLFKLKLLLLLLLSVISFILNPFLGVVATFFSIKKAKDMYEDAKFECSGANLKKVKWHINNSISSLNDCKSHIDTLAEKRTLELEKENLESKKRYMYEANCVLGKYLVNEEVPEMSDETRWELIKMLREDLNTEELDLNRLLSLALDITPVGVIAKKEARCRKKKGVIYE